MGIVILTTLLLAGCIQPISIANQTQTAEAPFHPTAYPTVPTPFVGGPNPAGGITPPPASTSPSMAGQFIANRGDNPADLQVWYDQPLGPDRLQGFSYTGKSGLPCVGFLLTALTNGVWQPNNGGLVCAAQPGVEGPAAVTFFLTSDGQAYTIVFGRVQNTTVSTVAIVYADGSSQPYIVSAGGFLLIRSGVQSVSRITGINAQGFTVIDNIPQSPVL